MKIKKMLSQHRRDFTAILECEGCGATEELKEGYDDHYYHDIVIPNMKCKKCNQSSNMLGEDHRAQKPKYEKWEVV